MAQKTPGATGSFLALKVEPVGEVQILRPATAAPGERRKKFNAQIMFFSHKKF
jgi:hypothetical protein